MKLFIQLIILFFANHLVAQNGVALVENSFEINNKNSGKNIVETIETSFELMDRMIIVEAKLDGKMGKYILDTGSPLLILNKTPRENSTTLGGISKNGNAELVLVDNFQWAGISNKEIDAVAYDMSNLENALGFKINGLIGQNTYANYELFLDVANQKIQLFKAFRSKLHKNNKYQQQISFSDKSHLPIITVRIDGKKYRFGIDTGAEVNVLNKNLKHKLINDLLKNFKPSSIHGLGGVSQKVESADLTKFKIKRIEYENLNFLLTDLTSFEEENNLQLDGILGYPFLVKNTLSINYQKQKIYIW
ncbi:MAG: pepsin/retropepsin-like aspartic protease family protein [Saprospiraceae bacterium]